MKTNCVSRINLFSLVLEPISLQDWEIATVKVTQILIGIFYFFYFYLNSHT